MRRRNSETKIEALHIAHCSVKILREITVGNLGDHNRVHPDSHVSSVPQYGHLDGKKVVEYYTYRAHRGQFAFHVLGPRILNLTQQLD